MSDNVKSRREERIRALLVAAFSPHCLRIENQSHHHIGHAGSPSEEDENYLQSHFFIEMGSASFRGLSKVKAQQSVYRILDEEFKTGLHALSLKLYP